MYLTCPDEVSNFMKTCKKHFRLRPQLLPLFQRPELISNSVPAAPRETALQTEIKEIFVRRAFKFMMPERQGYILILLVNLPPNSSLVQRLHHSENIDAGINEVSNIMKI